MKIMISRYRILATILAVMIFTAACGTTPVSGEKSNTKLTVVATLFPQYDFARTIAGDLANVRLLLPPGVESHAYEPAPRDVVDVRQSSVFIFTGPEMEPWALKLAEEAKADQVVVVDASAGIDMLTADEEHEGENQDGADAEGEEHVNEGGNDPHIWLDPVLAKQMVENILNGLIAADPTHEAIFRENAAAYQKELDALHAAFTNDLSKTASKTIIYGGHFAFGYLANRYELDHISPYNGFAPDAEPSPQKIAELIDLMNDTGLKVIYYEELVDPKVSRVIADQTGAEMMLLHGAHNLSKDELASGITYLQIMTDNLEKLKKGLGYHE